VALHIATISSFVVALPIILDYCWQGTILLMAFGPPQRLAGTMI